MDINIDPTLGEITTADNLAGKAVYDFTLLGPVEGADNDHYLYAEIAVPSGFEQRYSDNTGIHITIPYTPSYKQLMVRVRVDHPGGGHDYIINSADNRTWFSVYLENQAGEPVQVRLSELRQLSEKGNYTLIIRRGYMAIYAGEDTDFQIRPALRQNEVFLLKAVAGNLYQYPTTGVGLIDFLHGNFENTGLAAKLQSEFENDRMIINNAYMNSETGELLLDVTERNG